MCAFSPFSRIRVSCEVASTEFADLNNFESDLYGVGQGRISFDSGRRLSDARRAENILCCGAAVGDLLADAWLVLDGSLLRKSAFLLGRSIGNTKVTAADIAASNGVIHVSSSLVRQAAAEGISAVSTVSN